MSLRHLRADGRVVGQAKLDNVWSLQFTRRRFLGDHGLLNDIRSRKPDLREGVLNKIRLHQPRIRANYTMNRISLEDAVPSVTGTLVLEKPIRPLVDFQLNRQVHKLCSVATHRDEYMQRYGQAQHPFSEITSFHNVKVAAFLITGIRMCMHRLYYEILEDAAPIWVKTLE